MWAAPDRALDCLNDSFFSFAGPSQGKVPTGHKRMRKTSQASCRTRILVIEDDTTTASLLRLYLEEEGYVVTCAHDGILGLALATREEPDLVILDLMLPGLEGWDICRGLRKLGDVPILIVSARQEERDRLLGLGLGADDYVVKPFSPREVVARVKAILRRSMKSEDEPQRIGVAPILLDPRGLCAIAYGKEVGLTPSEYRLLTALISKPGRTYSRDELLQELYPNGARVVLKAIDVHMANLRQKLEPEPSRPRHLVTVRGFGYRFQSEQGSAT